MAHFLNDSNGVLLIGFKIKFIDVTVQLIRNEITLFCFDISSN